MLRRIVLLSAVLVVVFAAYEPDRVLSLPDAPPMPSATYAGYLSVSGGRQAYYYFSESQATPTKDPLVIWLNGGPTCSSLDGNFIELGALYMGPGGKMDVNPYSWNKIANLLFIESPPGVGYSQDNPLNATLYTDDLTSLLNYETLQGFLFKFPEYIGRDLYITGESYAGHYVPQFAMRIYQGDETIKKMMKGFMVGNPCTGEIGCDAPTDPTLNIYLSTHGLIALDPNVPANNGTYVGTYDPYDILVNNCQNQHLANKIRFRHPVVQSFRRKFKDVPIIDPCNENYLAVYLNRTDVKQALHAVVNKTWLECGAVNYTVNPNGVTDLYQTFMNNTDWKIIVYSGTADTVVNFIQTETIIFGLKRRRISDWRAWNYTSARNGPQEGGFYVNFDRVSYATVQGSGHMVPEYQPAPALHLFASFLTTGRPGP